MLEQVTTVAAESIRQPTKKSVWHPGLKKYLCPGEPGYEEAVAAQSAEILRTHPPINSTFKLVFLTVVVGTFLSFASCGALAALAGKDPPDMQTRLFHTLLDLGKIGGGAIIGLLGGQSMRGSGKR